MDRIKKTQNNNDISFLTYRITVQGRLDAHWGAWFSDYVEDITIPESGICRTILTVKVPDQAALRGILSRIWDLNLILISVIPESCKEDQLHRRKENV